MSLRDHIKTIDDSDLRIVRVPEWDKPATTEADAYECKIKIVSLSALERTKWEESLVQGSGKKAKAKLDHARAALVIRAARDPESGSPIFKSGDESWLSGKNSKPLSRLYDVAAELSGITDDDIEELAEN